MVKGLVGPLSVELSEYYIRVYSISPGVFKSSMTAALQVEYPHLFQMFNNAAPVSRMGVPEDLTPMITYLLSDAAAFTTGADVPNSGGIHAGIRPSWMHHAMPQD
jgi:NAD(P)-dependent dehydrogenase (short-subunit alcohol dehydrogenase family)